MFEKIQLKVLCLTLLTLIFAIGSAHADTIQAGCYLESAQNADGSWGADSCTIYFETTEAIKALRLLGRTDVAYQRGVEYISNYDIGGVEDHARRIDAIAPAGR